MRNLKRELIRAKEVRLKLHCLPCCTFLRASSFNRYKNVNYRSWSVFSLCRWSSVNLTKWLTVTMALWTPQRGRHITCAFWVHWTERNWNRTHPSRCTDTLTLWWTFCLLSLTVPFSWWSRSPMSRITILEDVMSRSRRSVSASLQLTFFFLWKSTLILYLCFTAHHHLCAHSFLISFILV